MTISNSKPLHSKFQIAECYKVFIEQPPGYAPNAWKIYQFAGKFIPFRIQKWTPPFSPREETSIAMSWISFPSLPCQYFARNALFSMASAVGQPLDVDQATNDKTRPSTAWVKVEVDLLRTLPKRIRVQLKNLVTDEITNVWKKLGMIIYHIIVTNVNIRGIEKPIVELSLMVKLMPRLEVGEKDDEGTIKDLQIGAEKSDVQVQNLVRQNSSQRLGKAVLDNYSFGNRMLSLIPQQLTTNVVVQSNEPKNIVCTNPFEVLEVEKELELVDSTPTNDQTLVRANFDNNIQSVSTPIGVCSMQTEKHDSVMSPTYSSNPEVAKIIQESEAAMLLKPNSAIKSPMVTLNTSAHEVSKEKHREMITPRWADLVDEEEHVSPLLLSRKLSPQALEFVPNSIIAKKKQEALALEFSPTRGYDSDLGDDSFDEDEEENMLDICFDKVARDGDISPRHQRSGSNKNKKKTHGRQHS
uniref:NB-ARC domain containing protein n=1 Tax=Solanum tuberosum TaxID=4113 RepID=M1E0P6_SOLTU